MSPLPRLPCPRVHAHAFNPKCAVRALKTPKCMQVEAWWCRCRSAKLSYPITMSEEEEYRHVYNFIAIITAIQPVFLKTKSEFYKESVKNVFVWRMAFDLYYAVTGKGETKDDQQWRQVAKSVEDRERIMQSCHSSAEGKYIRFCMYIPHICQAVNLRCE